MESDVFNQDDSDPDEIEIQGIGMYEGGSDTSHDNYKYCNMMTICRPPSSEDINGLNKWTRP